MRVCTFGCSDVQIQAIESHFAGAPVENVRGADAQGWARCIGVTLPIVSVDTGLSSLWLSVEHALSYLSGETPNIERGTDISSVSEAQAQSASERQVEQASEVHILSVEPVQSTQNVRKGLTSRDEAISQIDTRKAELLGKRENTDRTRKREMGVRKEGERRERI